MRSESNRLSQMLSMIAFSGVMGVSLLGCSVGPEPVSPDTGVNALELPYEHGSGVSTQLADMNHWWGNFNDEDSERLVALALKGNPSIKASAYRLIESQARLKAATAGFFPSVDLTANASRNRNVFENEFSGDLEIDRNTSLRMPGANVSWSVDIWGKTRRAVEQNEFSVMSNAAARDALTHQIIAQVIRARIQIAIGQMQLYLAEQNLMSLKKTLQIVELSYERNRAGADDVRLARENVAAAEGEVPRAKQVLETAYLGLDVLLGVRPGTGPRDVSPFGLEQPGFEMPPVGLPGHLLDRRPDLRQAALTQRGLTAGVGVQVANMLPDLTISANGTFFGSDITDLVKPERFVGSIVANLAWKIFSAGANAANVDAARALSNAAALDYTSNLLTAIQEVETALVNEKRLLERSAFAFTRLEEAQAAERIAKDRFSRGQRSLLFVLEIERRRRNAETALLAIQRDLWLNRVDLHLALGGDWGTMQERDSEIVNERPGEYSRSVDMEVQNPWAPFPLSEKSEAREESDETTNNDKDME